MVENWPRLVHLREPLVSVGSAAFGVLMCLLDLFFGGAAAAQTPPSVAPTSVQTDNQYEPVSREAHRTLPNVPPDEDGRYPMTVRGAYGQGIWFGEVSDSFALQLRVRGQMRLVVDSLEGQDPGLGAEVRRLRLILGGHVLRHLASYYVQLGFSASDLDDVEQVPLRDAFITFHLHELLNVRVGQMKVPFDRQRVTSSSTLSFVDRAEVVREMNLDRDIGLQLYSTDALRRGGELSYQLGIFGGEGRNNFRADPGLLYMGRLQLATTGFDDDFSEGDLVRGPPRMAIASAFGYNHRAQRESSTSGAYYSEGYTDFLHVTTDVLVKAHGLSLLFEGLLRKALDTTITGDPLSGWGILAQAGYLLPFVDVELVARVALQRPLAPSSLDDSTEIGGGISWYVLNHDLKLQLDHRATLFAEGSTAHLTRAQVQLYF